MEKIEVRYAHTGIDSAGGGNEGQSSELYGEGGNIGVFCELKHPNAIIGLT